MDQKWISERILSGFSSRLRLRSSHPAQYFSESSTRTAHFWHRLDGDNDDNRIEAVLPGIDFKKLTDVLYICFTVANIIKLYL